MFSVPKSYCSQMSEILAAVVVEFVSELRSQRPVFSEQKALPSSPLPAFVGNLADHQLSSSLQLEIHSCQLASSLNICPDYQKSLQLGQTLVASSLIFQCFLSPPETRGRFLFAAAVPIQNSAFVKSNI